jgi:hypothetical protein
MPHCDLDINTRWLLKHLMYLLTWEVDPIQV